jgi:hypothetical protein
MWRNRGIRRIIEEPVSVMDLARAATTAKFVGQIPHLKVASVAEFEASCLSLFKALHICSPFMTFPTSPSCFSPESVCQNVATNRNRLYLLQALCLSINTFCSRAI